MTRHGWVARRAPWWIGLPVALAMAGCGGGGGDDGGDSGPPGTIDITLANRDALARVAASAALGLAPLDVRAVLTAAAPSTPSHAPAREAAQAAVPWPEEICAGGGRMLRTLDDRDGSGAPGTGDVLTVQFEDCVDEAGTVSNGTLSLAITAITPGLPYQLKATATFAQYGALVPGGSRIGIDGAMDMVYDLVAANVVQVRMDARDPVSVGLQSGGTGDTLTLRPGFWWRVGRDRATTFRTTYEVNGQVGVGSLGGDVQVGTLSPLVQGAGDDHPAEGSIEVLGRNGSLTLTALSASTVHLRTDTDGNGTADDERDVAWSSLR